MSHIYTNISGVLPSGQGGYFDYTQSHNLRYEANNAIGSGINFPFPFPNEQTQNQYKLNGVYNEEWWNENGILKSYGPEDGPLIDPQSQTGVMHFNNLTSNFSNAKDVVATQINDFTIFNPYIHFERVNNKAVLIPYISTFKVAQDWNPYKEEK